ncbi:MAG: hypothetical protein EA379_12670 [Phycisphaerales bacterium]|nr:MAG: hypothetical protein EA379_12670 [Phycisphaerales bacterium]
MKLFTCTSCQQTVYFDSSSCTRCGADLGFVPQTISMVALGPDGRADVGRARWRPCDHQSHGCNWLVDSADDTGYCVSCRLNRTIPDLSVAQHLKLWQRLEQDKRRLVYSALRLRLPIAPKSETPEGLAFDFLADREPCFNNRDWSPERVLTGHSDGLITINIAEADPVARERMRSEMDEQYRTILGHFRHESGHYYWDRLVRDAAWITPCRDLFGDERADYGQALQSHYECGPPANWWERHVSAYASSHPWEDWAESWSHYLHMVDTLETAWAYGLALEPRHAGAVTMAAEPASDPYELSDFPTLISQWMPLTVALNSLNRSMGHEPAYPFALATPVIEKLAFVHRVMHEAPPDH